jgi:hypothetical protein
MFSAVASLRMNGASLANKIAVHSLDDSRLRCGVSGFHQASFLSVGVGVEESAITHVLLNPARRMSPLSG